MITIKYVKATKLKIYRQEIIVTFPYKSEIVDVIRTIFPRFWDVEKKEWHLEYTATEYLKKKLPNEKFKIIGKPVDNLKFREKRVEEFSLPSSLTLSLYKFQKKAYDECLSYNKYLLLLEQGLGKTIVATSVILKREELKQVKKCLVIVGVSGLKYTWENEIKEHTTSSCMVLGNRQNKAGLWNVKSNADKLRDIQKIKNSKELFYITNVESLRDKDIINKLKDLCKKGVINAIIFDEIHVCKSSSSKQGRAILSLANKVKYFYGLTGTILMNSPFDVYIPLKCVDKISVNNGQFKGHYGLFGAFGQVTGYKNLDELQAQLTSVSIRLRKEEELDLPDKIFINEYVEMGKSQRKIYDDVLETIRKDIDLIKLTPNPLAQLIRLRQATLDTSLLSSTVNESAKFKRASELISDIIKDSKSVVVFCQLKTVINNFYDILKTKYKKIALVTGDTKNKESQINLFKKDNDCHIILGTFALGTGYTLNKATTVIFLDLPWTQAAYSQMYSRIHRIGQTNSVNIINILCKNTIDERILKIVQNKGAMSDMLVDGKGVLTNKAMFDFIIN